MSETSHVSLLEHVPHGLHTHVRLMDGTEYCGVMLDADHDAIWLRPLAQSLVGSEIIVPVGAVLAIIVSPDPAVQRLHQQQQEQFLVDHHTDATAIHQQHEAQRGMSAPVDVTDPLSIARLSTLPAHPTLPSHASLVGQRMTLPDGRMLVCAAPIDEHAPNTASNAEPNAEEVAAYLAQAPVAPQPRDGALHPVAGWDHMVRREFTQESAASQTRYAITAAWHTHTWDMQPLDEVED